MPRRKIVLPPDIDPSLVRPVPGEDGYFASAAGDVYSDRQGRLKKMSVSWFADMNPPV
jgi:hypothetical protein